jgi:hypothetical protein
MNAVAISNNDMVYLHWSVEGKIPNCLGFSVIRHDDKARSKQALPAMVGFLSDTAVGKGGGQQIQGHKLLAGAEICVEGFVRRAWRDLLV